MRILSRVEAGADLNIAIVTDEVKQAVASLGNGRASGMSGLPAEFLRYAWLPASPDLNPSVALVLALTALLNCMFQQGHVPAVANRALVTPVYKKGSHLDTSNYRPLAVTEAVMRCVR